MTKNFRAFTLIELLIVVAIIAILAAIAVPNFLEAQTRSKVSRARADLRTLATAVESYAVDYNKYPPDLVKVILVQGGEFVTAEGFVAPILSTPISYLTTAQLPDPFVVKGNVVGNADAIYRTLFYQNVSTSRKASGGDASAYALTAQFGGLAPGPAANEKVRIGWSATTPWEEIYGAWKMGSLGPDQIYKGGRHIYDPTNGTVSEGDVYRSQKRSEGGGI